MPIDPSGTAPGLAANEKKPPVLHMRCNNMGCDSMTAIEIQIPGQERGHRLYQCCKCKHTRGLAVGGSFNL
jgi:hypothetical protein